MPVTLNAEALQGAAKLETTAEATRLLSVATELVNRYASGAPDSMLNEAVIRVAGYLSDQPSSARTRSIVGPISESYRADHLSALRNSGAMALLSPWKVRRGGAIG